MAEYTDDQLKELIGTAVSEATTTANGEAAGFRVELKKLREENAGRDEAAEAEKVRLAAENGQFQDLYTTSSNENTTLKSENESLLEFKQNREALDQKELETLLPNIPEEYKALVDGLPLAKQLEMARTFAKTKPTPPGFREPGTPTASPLTNSVDRIAKGLRDMGK